MISKSAILALAALAELGRIPRGAYAGAGELARRTGAPRNYLGKILKTLADARLLESQKGKGGGFRLARDPHSISLWEVADPIERLDRRGICILGRAECSDRAPCPAHRRWKKARDAYFEFLTETTLADLR